MIETETKGQETWLLGYLQAERIPGGLGMWFLFAWTGLEVQILESPDWRCVFRII